MTTPIGAFGAPPDAVSWAALAAGLALALWTRRRARIGSPSDPANRVVVFVLAGVAFLLSAGYVAYYLRGGPRIIDATSYYLEARAFSAGNVAMPILSPSGSFRGRFLLASDDGRSMSVIFPPGYPALLALGFLARAPMLVGPVIAAALVVVTYELALRLFDDVRAARLAAALSVVCAVLRYHTADTMSHGLAALLFAGASWAALDKRRSTALAAGALSGWLVATRPASGVLCGVLALAAARGRRRRLYLALGAVPPLVAFAIEQRYAAGSWLVSSQAAYYAVADAPAGCFRYGFGSGIGCRFEHGDFVRAHLEHGYGFSAALGTTLRRLKMHLGDAANLELFAPVLVYALVRSFRERKGRLAAVGVLGIVAAYAPFYFDGNYPAGGARFYADALPLEHALVAWALVDLRLASFAIPAALFGFALHTSYDHRKLAAREGGRPMFESPALAKWGIERGLVFVSTDHGFNLGFDPGARDAGRSIVVARRRGDDHDALLWERLGRPSAYRYEFDPRGDASVPSLAPIPELASREPNHRFEAEAEWPPLLVSGGSAEPVFAPCASGGRALWVEPRVRPEGARLRLEAPAGAGSDAVVRVGFVARPGSRGRARLSLGGRSWTLDTRGLDGCGVGEGPAVRVRADDFLELFVEEPVGIDFVELAPLPNASAPAGPKSR